MNEHEALVNADGNILSKKSSTHETANGMQETWSGSSSTAPLASLQNAKPTIKVYDRQSVLQHYRNHVNIGFTRLAALSGMPMEVYAEGVYVYDEQGDPYLDCGGYGVFILGHRHPRVVDAVQAQLQQHPMSTRTLLNPEMAYAAAKLASITPDGLNYVCFTNSGAEATELGIKLGRLNGKPKLVAMRGGYHGKTLGALSVTGRTHYQQPFLPLLPDVQFVPFGDAQALETILSKEGPQTTVILEPVQGEGGAILPPQGYLRSVQTLCHRYNAFLVLDEIQTGMGRLGAWWSADLEGVVPDVLLVGKGLSGGVIPVGAVVATDAAFAPLNREPLLHSSTFAGNPLAMVAAQAAIATIEQENLTTRASQLGKHILQTLTEIIRTHCTGLVREVRGVGLLIGIEFEEEHLAGDFMIKLLEQKVIVSHSLNAHKVLRLTPPAILTEADCQWLFTAVEHVAIELSATWRP